MTVGVAMLAHTAFDRAAQVARHWATSGCPVVIHVDKRVKSSEYLKFAKSLSDLENVKLCERHPCEWGTWSIVQATQVACDLLLKNFPQVQNVFLTSGSCIPLRPISELNEYLTTHADTDFIESATTDDVPWTVGGLDRERFTLRFPFSWKTQRGLFDRYVNLQRKLGVRRKIPSGIEPHMGSQWWCLTRKTLEKILNNHRRAEFDHYFKKVWIPDESYFQTMARMFSGRIQSQSLTLAKFDFQGKPYIFYDDHLQLLRRSNCFVARKTWHSADLLYDTFLDADNHGHGGDPNPGRIARLFNKAAERRTRGREGLFMQGRYPKGAGSYKITSAPYSIFEGFSELFEGFEPWLTKATGAKTHGHLFDKTRVMYADGQQHFSGAMSDSAALRDYAPKAFLSNLIWNTRGEHQCFQFGPTDNQKVSWDFMADPNAQISVISGAWMVSLFKSDASFNDLRSEAARLQKIESLHLHDLKASTVKARVHIWSLADFIEAPSEHMQTAIDAMGVSTGHKMPPTPKMKDMTGFSEFLQNLKNEGMHPWVAGEFLVENRPDAEKSAPRRSYQVNT